VNKRSEASDINGDDDSGGDLILHLLLGDNIPPLFGN
jgi:hypothetical protein